MTDTLKLELTREEYSKLMFALGVATAQFERMNPNGNEGKETRAIALKTLQQWEEQTPESER